jgi:hypothetical protein
MLIRVGKHSSAETSKARANVRGSFQDGQSLTRDVPDGFTKTIFHITAVRNVPLVSVTERIAGLTGFLIHASLTTLRAAC